MRNAFGAKQPASSSSPSTAKAPAGKPAAGKSQTSAAPLQIHPPGTVAAFVVQDHSWIIGEVLNYNQTTKSYSCQSKDPIVKADKVAPKDVWAPRVEYLDEDVDDLLMLTELHEASILFCLKKRYMKDVVYTNIGPIVVALNPFTFEIPWYKDDKMKDYLNEGVVIERNLPHTWAVAHNTYWEMRENRMNQTILISGESGAGKTEAAKIVVKYIGILSTLHGTKEQQKAMSIINQKVVAASPILESFGNAKTVRNDNSSRFGKFMQLQFDNDGFLAGSFAIKYLLEKSRIIGSATNERVYHSFYQLAVGDDHKLYGIGKNKKAYKMLDMGNCLSVDSIDDSTDFNDCKNAMALVGINDTQQTSIWKIVAGILSFQNVQFVEHEEKGNKRAAVDEDYEAALSRACEHWSVLLADVQRELCTSTRVARNERVTVLLDRVKALDTRDSCSKGLYDALFDWLVLRINETTDFKNSEEAKNGTRSIAHWIGLLDIFGFEDFVHNSFEQICINLANETLQNHYNTFIFKEDLRECEEEGLDVRHVTFEDNRGCLELLSLDRISVFSMLDEECKVSGTNKNFMDKLLQHFAQTKEKAGSKYFVTVQGKQKDNCFKIRHYAGDVTYTVDGWLEKNRDTFKDDMKAIFHRSTDSFVAALVPPIADEESSKSTPKLTVSAFFARQLQELMSIINSTNPHWIRCIKPHPAKQPRMFSHVSVMGQLRSAGVLETVKVRQGGYPIRFTQDLFCLRYKILCDQFKDTATTSIEKCQALFDKLELKKEIAQLGKTKVFLRNAAFVKLNRAKDEATEVHSLTFQRMARAFTVRAGLFSHYVRMHRDRLLAEKAAREAALRRKKEEQARKERIEREARERRDAAERESKTAATVKIQRVARRFVAFRQLKRCFLETKRNTDESVTTDLLDSWRGLTIMDLADHRVAIQEQMIRDRKSRTAAELAAAAKEKSSNNNKSNLDVNESTQQQLQRMEQRRKEMAQQKTDKINQIKKKNADADAIFEKKLQAARERQLLQQQQQEKEKRKGGTAMLSGSPFHNNNNNISGRRTATKFIDPSKLGGDDDDHDHLDENGKPISSNKSSSHNNNDNNNNDNSNSNDPDGKMKKKTHHQLHLERIQKKEQMLDAEINRKVEAARMRQDIRHMQHQQTQEQIMREEQAFSSARKQQQQQQGLVLSGAAADTTTSSSAAFNNNQNQNQNNNYQDDATKVIFENVRDSWSRQQQWSKIREDAFMQDRIATKERNDKIFKKEVLLGASNFRITSPSPLLSPIYNVLEDEDRHKNPYSGTPSRLTGEQLRREAVFQLQQQRKNSNNSQNQQQVSAATPNPGTPVSRNFSSYK